MADIGSRTARAAAWSLSATIATRLISLVSLIILARLLAPRDFGLLAFALVYITYVETIGDLGSSLALIYWPDRKDDAAQVTFWINLASGLVWFVVTLLLAPAIAAFFNSPDGAGIVRLLAWSFPIKYLGNTHDALAQKELRFGARMIPELGLGTSKAILSIVLARAGLGGWSLAWGHLAGLTCWTAMLWMAVPWRPRFRFPTDLLRPMLRYGRGMITVNVLAAVVHHIDLAVVGRMLGAAVLGVYQMGSRVPDMTISVIIWGAGRVLFPAFAAVHAAGESLKNAYLQSVRYMSLLTVPVAAMLVVTAEPLVLVLFGRKWTAAIPILQAMAVYSGLRALGSPAGDVLKAIGRSDLLARLAVVKAAVLIPALIAAGTRDATTVAIALVTVTALTTLLNFGVAMVKVQARASEIGAAVRVSLIGGVVLAAVAMLLHGAIHVPPVLELLIVVPAGFASYAGTVALLDRSALREAREKLFSRTVSKGEFMRMGRFLIPRDAKIRRHCAEYLNVTHRLRDRVMHAIAPRLLLGRREGTAVLEDIVPPDGLELLRTITDGAPLRPIVVSDYEDSGRSRIVLFLFEENASRPAAVAKLRPLSGSGLPLEREWQALRVAQDFAKDLRDTIPKPLRYERSATHEALLLSHLPGRSAYLEIHDLGATRHIGRHFDAAADWLARFHDATRSGSHCAVHGDFWSRNLLMSGSAAAGVIDWEHFSSSGSPFEDLFHFPLTYGLNVRDSAVFDYLQRYARATGQNVSLCRDWLESYLGLQGERPSRPQSPGVSPGDHGDRARRALAAGETPALRGPITTEPLRILWLIDSLTLGGAESLVLPFARAIDRKAELRVCCLKSIGGNPIEQRLREAGVPVINLGARNLRDIRAFRRLLTLLREQRIQLVHAHLTYAAIWGAIAARMAGVRAVATLHVAPTAGRRDRVREWLMMRLLRWTGSHAIAVSEAVRRAFRSRYPAAPMEVIHNGIEVEAFERRNASRSAELKHEFGFAENAPVIVTVSVLRAGKGIDVLLRAVRHVNAQLLVVGDGPMRTAWSALGDGRVVWAGSRDDVPRLLAGADLFVLPSLDDAFPTVLLEAMAAELPVVATQVGGIPEIVDSTEVGVLVPPGDVAALADAIEALLRDEERRCRIAAAGRRRVVEEFSTQRWTERLMTLYRSAQ